MLSSLRLGGDLPPGAYFTGHDTDVGHTRPSTRLNQDRPVPSHGPRIPSPSIHRILEYLGEPNHFARMAPAAAVAPSCMRVAKTR
jgi:hypothetical protein